MTEPLPPSQRKLGTGMMILAWVAGLLLAVACLFGYLLKGFTGFDTHRAHNRWPGSARFAAESHVAHSRAGGRQRRLF